MFAFMDGAPEDKRLAAAQKQLMRLQSKATQTPADALKIAGLTAEIASLQNGAPLAVAKQASTAAQQKAKPPAPGTLTDDQQQAMFQDAPTNYTPWLIGGGIVLGGLVLLALFTRGGSKE